MKLSQIFKIIKELRKSKDYILYIIPEDKKDNIENVYSSDSIDEDIQAFIFNDIKENLINKLGKDEYANRLEKYDKDLFNAYKEADFHYARANYLESSHEYYKIINDPNGGDANKTYMLYKKMLMDRDKYQKYSNQ